MKKTFFSAATVVALCSTLLTAQTKITPPSNKYDVSEDVRLGQQAAAEARQQLPLMTDDAVTSYVANLGRKLVDAIPPELQHSEFRYTFETVNVREINAFALPGGPMFVNRGMIEAASSEGEVAGVMAHEISHVVLRHGTAQASKASKYEIGQILGAIGGAIIGGQVGSIIAQGTQFGLGAAFLRFGREYEKQADIEGSQIMARAGYDPREMANMFRTIEKQGGSNGPEWLSDHPNPGNRVEYITKEAEMLHVANAVTNSEAFNRVKAHLRTLPKAPTTEEATKNRSRRTSNSTNDSPMSGGRISARVEPPSTRYSSYTEGNLVQLSVPSNWRELASQSSVTFAPEGAYGEQNGQSVFTHGVQIGVAAVRGRDLRTATDEFVDALTQGNPQISQLSGTRQINVAGRQGLQMSMGNVNEATGREEVIQLVTAQMNNGSLFYWIGVAPRDESSGYQQAFQRVISSIRLRE
jgi:Zn-dependent protease with chaperone function